MKKVPNIKKTPKENTPVVERSLRGKKFSTGRVKCAIFQSKNESIARINKAINEAEDVEKKAHLADRLIKEVEALLSCKYFDEKRADCKICHYIAKLRKRTANLIIKAKELKTRN